MHQELNPQTVFALGQAQRIAARASQIRARGGQRGTSELSDDLRAAVGRLAAERTRAATHRVMTAIRAEMVRRQDAGDSPAVVETWARGLLSEPPAVIRGMAPTSADQRRRQRGKLAPELRSLAGRVATEATRSDTWSAAATLKAEIRDRLAKGDSEERISAWLELERKRAILDQMSADCA